MYHSIHSGFYSGETGLSERVGQILKCLQPLPAKKNQLRTFKESNNSKLNGQNTN